MRPSIRPLAAAILGTTLALSAPAKADQTDRIVFDVVLKGLTAGRLTINGKITGTQYGANGVMETTGLAGLLKTIRYDATVSGGFAAGRFTPQHFALKSQRGDARSAQTIVYKGGVPVSVSREPPRTPRPADVDPAKQGGTIDPLTALYAVLRDVNKDEACQLSVTLYDGAKRSQVALNPAKVQGERVSCAGEYRRLQGFSEKEMAEKSRFPFTLTYAPTPDGARLQVIEISTDTILGKARMKRR